VSDDQGPDRVAHTPGRREGGQDRESQIYQIRIRAHLDDSWSAWLEGLRVIPEADGTTLLEGPVVDQPALHGLLVRIRDLDLPLVAVTCIGPTWSQPPVAAGSHSGGLDCDQPAREPLVADPQPVSLRLCPGQASHPSGPRSDRLRNGGKKR
jgi:hypothetical protein